jgi:hypothetical protein
MYGDIILSHPYNIMERYLMYKNQYLALKQKQKQLGGEFEMSRIACPDPTHPYYDPVNMRCCDNNLCDQGYQYMQNIISLPTKIKCKGHAIVSTFTNPRIDIENLIDFNFDGEILKVPGTIKLTGIIAGILTEIRYNNPIVLYGGSYGLILKYENLTGQASFIALKIGNISDDMKAIRIIKGSRCKNLIVPSVLKPKYLVMEFVSGNLEDLIDITKINDHVGNQVLLNIIDQIIQVFKCLMDLGLFYTDIKVQNILYRCQDNNVIQIILGDLGSAKTVFQTASCTFIPFDRWDDGGKIYMPRESDIVWGIGMLWLQLLGLESNIMECCYWDSPHGYDTGVKQLTGLLDHLDTVTDHNIANIIKRTLELDRDKRPSLEQLLKIVRASYGMIVKKFMKTQTDQRS